jgi:hypothetical protein
MLFRVSSINRHMICGSMRNRFCKRPSCRNLPCG